MTTNKQGRDRPEPTLGHLEDFTAEDDLRPGRGRHSSSRPAGRRGGRRGSGFGIGTLLLTAVVAVAATLVYVNRDRLRDLVSGSETRALVEAAVQAERDGRWYGDADGQDALALYRRIIEIDADNDPARLGLRRAGQHLAGEVEAAIQAGDYDRAEALIGELETLGEPGERIAALRGQVESGRSADLEIETLLEQARSALRAGRIQGDDGALAGFKRMLARDADNAVARRGIDDALAVLLAQARQELAAERVEQANELADAIATERAQHADLPALRQEIAQAQARLDARAQQEATEQAARAEAENAQRVAREIATAGQHERAGRLNEAVSGYRRVLARDDGNVQARDGLARVGAALLDQADAAIANSDTPRARNLLEQARRADADAGRIGRLASRLSDVEERLAAVLARPELDAGQERRRDELMARARAADQRGDLVEPAGDSAYDLYRQVLAIDPMHDDARRAVSALPRRAQTLAVHHLQLGQIDQASRAVDALQAMAPLDPVLPELRRQLADSQSR